MKLSEGDRALLSWYRRFFSIAEIETNTILQLVFGATLLSYFLAFSAWINSTTTTIDAVLNNSYVCWPHFQNCAHWMFLRALPHDYTQTTLYMVLFGTLILSSYFVFRKEWVFAHVALIPSYLWHMWVVFFISFTLGGNYDYYLFVFATVLLFLPHKEFFLKLSFVTLYFLSTIAKIHGTWILGTYFSALKTGLPLLPDALMPLWTNLVICMEMVGAWFLLSGNRVRQRIALTFFVVFHLYSGILVEYRYPATVLPTLIILFGPLYRVTRIPFDRRAIVGFLCIGMLFLGQFTPVLIYGDEKLTHEGNRYGLYMFEANHQCVSTTITHLADGTERRAVQESYSARSRCEPYRYWFRIHSFCEQNETVTNVEWTFDHSINGGPFLRIVEVPDACALSYKPFSHNDWIKTERDNPEIVGYPVENVYE
jgi:hypothetical protein